MAQSQGFRLGRVLGISIYIDFSWIIIFSLVTYWIELQFSQQHSNWSSTQLWSLGLLTSLLFFGSILLHELAHSVVAQRYKLKVVSITLFIFGGIARIGREPSKAIQEFNIAVAGPIASLLIAGLAYLVTVVFHSNQMIGAVAGYLAVINLSVAVFNLLPGFPLDGGRILRSILWGATKDFSKATIIAGGSGKVIAYILIVLGVVTVYKGSWNGIWTGLVGWFLLNAAQASVQQVTIRETLTGLTAEDVMSNEVPTIPGNMSLDEYSGEVLRTGRRVHIVTSDDRLVGLMNVAALNTVPRDEWNMNSVQAAMVQREKILWAAPEEPLQRLLERLIAADVNQMPVVRHGEDGAANIVGMVTRDAILRVIQTRSELGHAAAAR
jgi:Zn-dependent protease/predicted transcriptional regulator